jgi:hypothetical protein
MKEEGTAKAMDSGHENKIKKRSRKGGGGEEETKGNEKDATGVYVKNEGKREKHL